MNKNGLRTGQSLRELASSGSFIVMLVLAVAVLLGPFIAQDANQQEVTARLSTPSLEHWLGTDAYGRDILARLLVAGRFSLVIGLAVASFASILGAIIGILSGYFPRVSSLFMRLMDAMLAFPAIILSIVLVTTMGAGMRSEIIALSLVFSPYIARVVRSGTLSVVQRNFIQTARASSASHLSIILRHILPNLYPIIAVQFIVVFALTLLVDGTLSFLGMGVPLPNPTWGNMIAESMPHLARTPLYTIAPGLMIALCVLTLNAFADRIRRFTDQKYSVSK